MRQLGRPYLQHARRHLPGGSDPIPGLGSPTVGVAGETFFLDSSEFTGTTSSTVLKSGQEYVITVQGTYTLWNAALEAGAPEADAMFPGSTAGRVSTEVGLDAECIFAYHDTGSGTSLEHEPNFQMDLANTGDWEHIEPIDGAHAIPAESYLYTYRVTGRGSVASFRINDEDYSDNYGLLKILIQLATASTGDGSGSGAGTGTLVPPAGDEHSILRVASGVPAWEARPDIVEADLDLSDNTTANVSTAKHGFAPKLPNDATQYLDGSGAYSVPSGSGGGSLPDPSGEPDGAWLKTSSGAAVWAATPAVAESDLNFSDVATANASTSLHGLLRKLDGSTTNFLRGDGSWSDPLATSGISRLYDSGALGADAATIDTGAGGVATSAKHLLIMFSGRTAQAVVLGNTNFVLNGETGSQFDRFSVSGNSSTVTRGSSYGATSFSVTTPGDSSDSSVFGGALMLIPDYTSSIKHVVLVLSGYIGTALDANAIVQATAARYRISAAITRVAASGVSGNLRAGSRLTIYGLG